MGKGFIRKTFSKDMLGLDERKGRSVVEQDFHESFHDVKVKWFLAFFSSDLD